MPEDQAARHAPKMSTLLLAIAAPFVAVGVLAAPLVFDLARHAGV